MSKVETKIEDGKVVVAVDSNEDGQASLKLNVKLDEAIKEAIKRGDKVEGEAVVKFKMTATGLSLDLDTDRDGVPSLSLEADLGEIFDEVQEKI